MTKITFQIKDGKIVGKDRLWDSVKRYFQTIQADGRYVWNMPEKVRHTRSIQQNRYYHGVVCKLIADHTGYSGDEIHQLLAEQFLSYEKGGKSFVRSTTKLKTAEFENYLESCRRWAAMDLQVYIPLPNERDNFFYEMKDK